MVPSNTYGTTILLLYDKGNGNYLIYCSTYDKIVDSIA